MEKIIKDTATSHNSAKLVCTPRLLLRGMMIVIAYLFAFITFDFITLQFQELQAIVAWYPPAGLTYALLLAFGAEFTPVVTLVLLISSILIYRMPQPLHLLFLWAIIISLIYGAASSFLRKRIHLDWQLRKTRDVIWFVFTMILVSALLAILSVFSLALSSSMPRNEIPIAIFHWWIGETVGVLTVTPFLLVYVMPFLKRFMDGETVKLSEFLPFPRPKLTVMGQASVIALTLIWVFFINTPDEFRPMYLVALPLIWIAIDRGFKGVTIGIIATNFGVMIALRLSRIDLAQLGELQLLMIINCILGLFLGAVVTERRQVEVDLRDSEERFRSLFEDSPVSLWEEDFSAVKLRLDALKAGSSSDLPAFFKSHPEEVANCASLIKVLDVNKAALKLYGARDKAHLINNLAQIVSVEYSGKFIEELVNISSGLPYFNYETVNQSLGGKKININLSWSAAPGHENDLSRVLISIMDITERKNSEEKAKKQLSELQRWHKITLGRENHILDLKREVNDLLGKTNQPPRYPSVESQEYLEK